MTTYEELTQKINDFVSPDKRSESSPGGGWAPVQNNDIAELRAIVLLLLEMRYERDADGDLPINVHFLDRTKYENASLSYYRHLPGDGNVDEYQRILIANIRSAHSAVESATRRQGINLQLLQDLLGQGNG